jgi:hypothetical protein
MRKVVEEEEKKVIHDTIRVAEIYILVSFKYHGINQFKKTYEETYSWTKYCSHIYSDHKLLLLFTHSIYIDK